MTTNMIEKLNTKTGSKAANNSFKIHLPANEFYTESIDLVFTMGDTNPANIYKSLKAYTDYHVNSGIRRKLPQKTKMMKWFKSVCKTLSIVIKKYQWAGWLELCHMGIIWYYDDAIIEAAIELDINNVHYFPKTSVNDQLKAIENDYTVYALIRKPHAKTTELFNKKLKEHGNLITFSLPLDERYFRWNDKDYERVPLKISLEIGETHAGEALWTFIEYHDYCFELHCNLYRRYMEMYINSLSDEVLINFIKLENFPCFIKYCANPSDKVIDAVLDCDPYLIKYIYEPTETQQLKAVNSSPECIDEIYPEPCEAAIELYERKIKE